jgi:hypothetical protein
MTCGSLFAIRMARGAMLALALPVTLSGCSVYHVSRAQGGLDKAPQTLEGAPYYLKKHRYEQVTKELRERDRIRLEMTILSPAPVPKGAPATVSASREVAVLPGDPGIAKLRSAIADYDLGKQTLESVVAVFDKLTNAPIDDYGRRTIANYVEEQTVVDFDNPLFLNAKVPLFGSSTLKPTFGDDGSLSSVESSAEGGGDKLVSAITSLVPIKEVLTSKWVPQPQKDVADASKALGKNILDFRPPVAVKRSPKLTVRLELTIEPQVNALELRKSRPTPLAQDTTLVELKKGEPGVSYRELPVETSSNSKDDADAKSLQFSGSVKMPQAKVTEAKPKSSK